MDRLVSLDMTEGSWISLDVSPDGETIVFDFLGDLFTIPIAGGDATQLTSEASNRAESPEWLAYPVQHDDQESRATLDVLPGMSFTPDSRYLVALPRVVAGRAWIPTASPAWAAEGGALRRRHAAGSPSAGRAATASRSPGRTSSAASGTAPPTGRSTA